MVDRREIEKIVSKFSETGAASYLGKKLVDFLEQFFKIRSTERLERAKLALEKEKFAEQRLQADRDFAIKMFEIRMRLANTAFQEKKQ
jgi:hypothetical protein